MPTVQCQAHPNSPISKLGWGGGFRVEDREKRGIAFFFDGCIPSKAPLPPEMRNLPDGGFHTTLIYKGGSLKPSLHPKVIRQTQQHSEFEKLSMFARRFYHL
eukprot:Hpha_TRINITY_DN15401_c0_g1::TRINITY_DN15401_c0_g1_i2::g.174522::m.174522